MEDEGRIRIAADADLVLARQKGRRLAAAMGFSGTDATLIATAISELARNILAYAGVGEIELARIHEVNVELGKLQAEATRDLLHCLDLSVTTNT